MNQSQRRQKNAGIRQQQKFARLAKRPQPLKLPTLHELIASTEKAITENEGYIAEDAKGIAKFKFLLQVASIVYVTYALSLVCYWKKGNDVFMILLASGFMVFFIFIYFSCKNGTQHWVVDLEDRRKYLKELELRLSTSK